MKKILYKIRYFYYVGFRRWVHYKRTGIKIADMIIAPEVSRDEQN